mmetsp:Transcript_32622/g.103964  ORF Transcript_32622/g.103964 Transcript_32622/m.103964 type:complete len:213 (+) Transcript_32622:150-788(+)
MSIMSYNGGAIIAMTGKDCVGIACDLRFGVQNQTLSTDYKKVFQVHDHLYLGLSGLGTDMQTLSQKFQFRHNLYKLREERNMKPSTFANLVSSMLYEKRFGPFFCEPVIAGLEPDGTPFITGMDLLGAMAPASDFVVAGSSSEALFGVCESMYRENLEAEDLFETLAQCILSGVNRDALSGWGAVVYIMCALVPFHFCSSFFGELCAGSSVC